jgi:hypothetical protein
MFFSCLCVCLSVYIKLLNRLILVKFDIGVYLRFVETDWHSCYVVLTDWHSCYVVLTDWHSCYVVLTDWHSCYVVLTDRQTGTVVTLC